MRVGYLCVSLDCFLGSNATTTTTKMNDLGNLCTVHHQLELFTWLQNKLPSSAVEAQRAAALKESAIEMINSGLRRGEKLLLEHDYVAKDIRTKKQWADARRDGEE